MEKQPLEVFCKKGVLRRFPKFTGKHLCQSLAQVLSCEVCKISKNTFFTDHLRATASGNEILSKTVKLNTINSHS